MQDAAWAIGLFGGIPVALIFLFWWIFTEGLGSGRSVPVASLFATGRPWNRRHRTAAESLLGWQRTALPRRPHGIRAYASLAARGWRRHTNFRLHPACSFFRDCLPSILRFRPA